MRSLFFVFSVLAATLSAESFFTLRGVDKVYPVVEISGSKVPQSEKKHIREAMLATTQELGIDTKGYSQRSLAMLVGEQYFGKTVLINVRLVIGEQVRRMGSEDKVFGNTYESAVTFPYHPESVTENLEDAVDELLEKFADQYRDEQGTLTRVSEKGEDIAASLGYETNYAAAMAKAAKANKNVMLVLVSNFCPWCQKFEQQVLRKQDVNTLVHAKYVPVIINKEKDAFPAELNLSFTPVVYFIDPKTQQSYHRIVGYSEREEFLHWIHSDGAK